MSRPFLDRETTVRALSGIAFVLVVLGAAQLGVWTQLILWTAVGTGAWFEWQKHTPQASWISKLGRVVLFGSLAGMMWFLPQMNGSVYDPQRVFLFLGLVWTNDTLARPLPFLARVSTMRAFSLGNLPVMYSCRLLFDRLVIRPDAI